jgi:hypothetical protein
VRCARDPGGASWVYPERVRHRADGKPENEEETAMHPNSYGLCIIREQQRQELLAEAARYRLLAQRDPSWPTREGGALSWLGRALRRVTAGAAPIRFSSRSVTRV